MDLSFNLQLFVNYVPTGFEVSLAPNTNWNGTNRIFSINDSHMASTQFKTSGTVPDGNSTETNFVPGAGTVRFNGSFGQLITASGVSGGDTWTSITHNGKVDAIWGYPSSLSITPTTNVTLSCKGGDANFALSFYDEDLTININTVSPGWGGVAV